MFGIKKIAYWLPVLILVSFSCDEILNVEVVGDGNFKSEQRNRSSFSGVFVDSDMKVFLSSSEQQKIIVEADSNLLSYLVTDVTDGILNVSVKPNFRVVPRQPVRVILGVASDDFEIEIVNGARVIADSLTLDTLNVSVYGVSEFFGSNMTCSRVDLFSEGSTEIRMEGEFEVVSVRQKGSGNLRFTGYSVFGDLLLAGSGKLDARNMVMDNADIRLYGSGLVFCNVPEVLDAKIDGSGRIYYDVVPQELIKDIDGGGRLLLLED
jgi:hypothetical protein